LLDAAPNRYTRTLLEKSLGPKLVDDEARIAGHISGQRIVAQNDTSAARMASNVETMVIFNNDPAVFEAGLAVIGNESDAISQRNGYAPDSEPAKIAKFSARSGAIAATIESRMATDPAGAGQMYRELNDQLTTKDREGLRKTVGDAEADSKAQTYVENLMNSGQFVTPEGETDWEAMNTFIRDDLSGPDQEAAIKEFEGIFDLKYKFSSRVYQSLQREQALIDLQEKRANQAAVKSIDEHTSAGGTVSEWEAQNPDAARGLSQTDRERAQRNVKAVQEGRIYAEASEPGLLTELLKMDDEEMAAFYPEQVKGSLSKTDYEEFEAAHKGATDDFNKLQGKTISQTNLDQAFKQASAAEKPAMNWGQTVYDDDGKVIKEETAEKQAEEQIYRNLLRSWIVRQRAEGREPSVDEQVQFARGLLKSGIDQLGSGFVTSPQTRPTLVDLGYEARKLTSEQQAVLVIPSERIDLELRTEIVT
ncbi:MAG: hypothetical protein ACRD2L_19145, partial [Terriglobia bacterium]